jgi:uncharacterized surface protein with fasciclin (FAS1) repeats
MRKFIYLFAIVASMLFIQSCDKHLPEAGFKDMERLSIYDYIVEHDSLYSKFRQILEAGGLDKTMSAYNPNGNEYTLFLPTNAAIDDFIANNGQFATFDDLLKNKNYVSAMARYHVVNIGIITNDFPFGALPELNLSGQYLTIGFEIGPDSSYYKINNIAPLTIGNIEVSNGYIHVISKALTPVTYNTYQWLEQNPQYSIFLEAVKTTGLDKVLSRVVIPDSASINPVTLFIEPDSIFNRNKIFSFNDLAFWLSPDNSDYTNPYNKLYNFVGCHILKGNLFLSDFEGKVTNYSTFGDLPVNINGIGIDLAINKGKEVFDTLISSENDTTYLDYITFFYDQSNVLTQSGAIHFINQVMTPKAVSSAEQYFEFYEEPLFIKYREEGGEFIIEDPKMLSTITWTGGNDQLVFVKTDDDSETAWNKDYIVMEGDFSISYTLPEIVQGSYTFSIRANAFNSQNALVEVYFDGVKVGGLIDLTSGGTPAYPYIEIELGTITLLNYESHIVTVTSLIPGFFYWDFVHFKPI